MASARTIHDLPHALDDSAIPTRLAGRRLAVFLDYDGVLTPIAERPEDAVMSQSMRDTVRALSRRCPVCVVSGRDRAVVQRLMGMDDLVVAGSHGFDIWSPTMGTIPHPAASGFEDLIAALTERLRSDTASIPGVQIESKRASVAVHYRQVAPADRDRVAAVVQAVLADHPDEVKLTPGKMVYELQPKLDWDKGRAVRYLMQVLGLDSDDVVPIYLGDDITDENAFRALPDRGVGILVARPDDPEVAGRLTAADYLLYSPDEVARFLDQLGR